MTYKLVGVDENSLFPPRVEARLDADFGPRLAEVLPAPTGVAATDSAALAAAITAVGSSGLIEARRGTYAINAAHVIPDGVDLIGQGGGSTSVAAKTIFRCDAAGARIELAGFKSMSGRFQVSQNVATTAPFRRSGGTGANAGSFINITVQGSGAGDAGGTTDVAEFYGAQNDLWLQCGFAEANRDLGVFDQGYGGATFLRCEWAGAGRYHHRYDNLITSPTYPVPTDNHHLGGIFERDSGVSLVYGKVGANNTYSDHAFYSANGCSGPMIDLVDTSGWELHNPWLQSTGSTLITGTEGIHVRNSSSVTITGRMILQNLDKPLVVDGVNAFIYDLFMALRYNSNGTVWPVNGASTAQVARFRIGSNNGTSANGTDIVEISQNLARDRYLWTRTASGRLNWYPGTATFNPDVSIERRAAGAVGVRSGLQWVLTTGVGTTAQRPAASAALEGAMYGNTTTGTLQWCDGTTWH